jgi:hypothetical protein
MQWIGHNTVLTGFGVNSLSDAQRESIPKGQLSEGHALQPKTSLDHPGRPPRPLTNKRSAQSSAPPKVFDVCDLWDDRQDTWPWRVPDAPMSRGFGHGCWPPPRKCNHLFRGSGTTCTRLETAACVPALRRVRACSPALLIVIRSLASWHRRVFVKAAYAKCVRAVWAADGGQRASAPPPTRESALPKVCTTTLSHSRGVVHGLEIQAAWGGTLLSTSGLRHDGASACCLLAGSFLAAAETNQASSALYCVTFRG